MARSEYIYLVHELDMCGNRLVAGFTVKRELVEWLRGNRSRKLQAMRVRDIGNSAWAALDPTEIDIQELLK
jgi:hypothetical protein